MGGLFGGGGVHTSEERIAGLQLQTSCYGVCKAVVLGTTRISGNLIWYGDFQAIAHTESQGGKGDGPSFSNTWYEYRAAVAIALCHGPIYGIGQFWQGKNLAQPVTKIVGAASGSDMSGWLYQWWSGQGDEPAEQYTVPASAPHQITVTHADQFSGDTGVVYPVTTTDGEGHTTTTYVPMTRVDANPTSGQYAVAAGVYTFAAADAGLAIYINYTYLISAIEAYGLSVFDGATPQTPWGYLTTNHPDEALGYSGLAYIAAANYALSRGAELPNHTVEIIGLHASPEAPDVEPQLALTEVLTAELWGAGWPAASIGDLAGWSSYTSAAGWRVSLGLTEQRAAGEVVAELMTATNSECVWSEGKLKVVPYGDETITGNGVTWTPNLTPIYDLTDDDFLPFDGGPVRQARSDQADAYNIVTLEWTNRGNVYSPETVEAKDAAEINRRGRRPADKIEVHCIHDGEMATEIAYLKLRRTAYVRPTYEIRLGWEYCLLEPMDILSINDAALGMSGVLVRIVDIAEDDEGTLTAHVEELLAGTGAKSGHGRQTTGGYRTNWAEAPGSPNEPLLIEAPFAATDGALELWVVATGPKTWGGADVYVSLDGETYSHSGAVQAGAVTGRLVADMAADADQVDVDVSESRGQLHTVSAAAAAALQSRIYIDGEWLTYHAATLIGAGQYRLSTLQRGLYGTAVSAHRAGSRFARMQDKYIQREAITTDLIGKTLRLKLVSYNLYGSGVQSIADCEAYSYTVTGAALKMPPDDIENLVSTIVAGQTVLKWDAITDVRRFSIEYEVRMGTSWKNAVILGRSSRPEFTVAADGTYWVAALVGGIYSAVPASTIVAGAVITTNVVDTYDEAAHGFPGTLSGGAVRSGGAITLSYSTSVAPEGYYTSANETDIGQEAACQLSCTYRILTQNAAALVSQIPQFSTVASVVGAVAGKGTGAVEVAIAPQSGVYGAWKPFYAGTYVGRKFKFRVRLQSFDPSVRPVLDVFKHTVDMPDRIERGIAVACPAAGLTVAFMKNFQIPPAVHISILNAQAGDTYVLTSVGESGFHVLITNGGVAVDRNINWTAHAY